MRTTHAAALLVGLALLVSSPAVAQSPAVLSGPTPVAWHPQPSMLLAPEAPLPLPQSAQVQPNASVQIDESGPHHSQAVAMMIVGVAGLVTGLIIDEDIVTIAGAGVAGVGLYLYLR